MFSQSEVIRCFSVFVSFFDFFLPCFKIAGRRMKRTKIWVLEGSVLGVCKVLFLLFPIFDNLAPGKRLVVEQNGSKFGPRGSYLVYIVILIVRCLRSV